MALAIDPAAIQVPAAVVSLRMLTNLVESRLAFKVTTTKNNDHYRLKPVLVSWSMAGPPKEDKLVIHFLELLQMSLMQPVVQEWYSSGITLPASAQ
uniref:Uncharacterized protein n=1 Tax=Ditylenchus dipsaci TaxID=166011 RepID=A0A915D1F6_9BILA